MIAYQTAVMSFKILESEKPSYIAEKIPEVDKGASLRHGARVLQLPRYKKSISR